MKRVSCNVSPVQPARSSNGDAAEFNELARAAVLRLSPDTDIEAMDFGLSIVRAGNRLQQDYEQQVHRPAGMTWATFRVLFTILGAGEISPMRLARLSYTSPASISSVLNTLERYGMTARTPDPTDKRAVNISLTPAGESAVRELMARSNQRTIDWSHRFTAEERKTLVELLGRLLHEPAPPDVEPGAPVRTPARGSN